MENDKSTASTASLVPSGQKNAPGKPETTHDLRSPSSGRYSTDPYEMEMKRDDPSIAPRMYRLAGFVRVPQETEQDATPAAREHRDPTSSLSGVMKGHSSWIAVTTGGAGTKLSQTAEHKQPFEGRVLSTMDSEDGSSGVVTLEDDSHHGGFPIGSEAELRSGRGSPGIAGATRDGRVENPGGVFVGSGRGKAGETVGVGAEGRPEHHPYALVQLSTRHVCVRRSASPRVLFRRVIRAPTARADRNRGWRSYVEPSENDAPMVMIPGTRGCHCKKRNRIRLSI